MIEVFLVFVISGPLGEREVPIRRFVDYNTCQDHLSKHIKEEVSQFSLSIGQSIKAAACKEIKK